MNKVFKWPVTPPRRYAGKWVAWNKQLTKVIAYGRTFGEVWHAARQRGEKDAMLEKVPRRHFAGAR